MSYRILLRQEDINRNGKHVADQVSALLREKGYRAIEKDIDYGHSDPAVRAQYASGQRFEMTPRQIGNESFPEGGFKEHLSQALTQVGCSGFTLTEIPVAVAAGDRSR